MGIRIRLWKWALTNLHTYLLTYLHSPWPNFLLEKLAGSQLASNSPHFMETESSLPRLKEPSTFPFPEPDQSSPCLSPPQFHFTKIHLNIILSFRLGLSEIEHTVSIQVRIRRKWFRETNSIDFLSGRSWDSSDDTGTKLLAGGKWNQSSISASVRHFPLSEASRPVLRSSQSSNLDVLGTLCVGLNQLEHEADCHISLRGVVLS